MSYRPKCVVRAPVATQSGYGEMSRDIVRHLIEYDKYDVEIHSINWGMTPMNALNPEVEQDRIILERIRPEQFSEQPDLYISISIPTEFQPIGKYNIGITAGIESTQAHVEWVDAMNRMNVNFVISEHAKAVFLNSKYQQQDRAGNLISIIEAKKPIEVLHNCVDTSVYRKLNPYDLDKSIKTTLDSIDEDYLYLFVGHWLRGDVGHDRKNVGLLIKVFLELFKKSEFVKKPALLLKTSGGDYSILDREALLNKIKQIKDSVELEAGDSLPCVYVIHGELTDKEMNSLYNHPKVKTHISLTKGEGFGRPLLEATLSAKPVIAPGWSGHLDFLNKDEAILLGGVMENVHPSVADDKMLLKEASWMKVDINMAANAMIEVYRNYSPWKKNANSLAMKNRERFNYNAIRTKFWQLLDNYVPEFQESPKRVELKLPQLKKIELPKLNKL